MVECLLYWLGFVYDLMVYIRFICLLYLIDVSESPRDKRKANKNGWTRLVTFYESEFRDKSALILRLIIHLPLNSPLKYRKKCESCPHVESWWLTWLFVFCLYPHLYRSYNYYPLFLKLSFPCSNVYIGMNYLIFVILISSALFKHVKVCQKVRKFTIKNWQKMPQIRGLDAMKYAGLKKRTLP